LREQDFKDRPLKDRDLWWWIKREPLGFYQHAASKGIFMLLVIELTHHRSKVFRLEFGAIMIILTLVLLMASSLIGYFFGGLIKAIPLVI
jgi:hypothetical protein